MKYRTIAVPLLLHALTISAPTHAESDGVADSVAASFARILAAPPTPAPRMALNANRIDPLLEHLLLALPRATEQALAATPATTAEKIATAAPEDPLAASFQRMLGHQPTAADYRYATESGNDPLLTHLASALHRKNTAGTPATPSP